MAYEPTARELLRRADQYARDEQYAEAVELYERVAAHYLGQGFALKAVAVAKMTLEIMERNPELLFPHARTIQILLDGYRQLGLDLDAAQIERKYGQLI